MDNDIYRNVITCTICQSRQNNKFRTSWPKPKQAWERVHLHLFDSNSSKYLIISDSYSKWIQCFLLRGKHDYKTILSKLAEVFARFSFPNTIVSDNGPPFCATELKDFCSRRKLMFIPHNLTDKLNVQFRPLKCCCLSSICLKVKS